MINTNMLTSAIESATPVAAELATEALRLGVVVSGALVVVEAAKVAGNLAAQGATQVGAGIAYLAEEAWDLTQGPRDWLFRQIFGDMVPASQAQQTQPPTT